MTDALPRLPTFYLPHGGGPRCFMERSRGPAARFAHPREAHRLPLMIAAGEDRGRRLFGDQVMSVTLSGFPFG